MLYNLHEDSIGLTNIQKENICTRNYNMFLLTCNTTLEKPNLLCFFLCILSSCNTIVPTLGNYQTSLIFIVIFCTSHLLDSKSSCLSKHVTQKLAAAWSLVHYYQILLRMQTGKIILQSWA